MRLRRAVACVFLIAGYLLPFRFPAICEMLIAQNNLWPEVAIIAGPTTAPDAPSSIRLLQILLAYAAGGVLLFEIAKLTLAGGWQRRAVITLAQIALPIDCVRAFAPDWWHYFTGLYSGGARCPWIAALFTLAAIVAVLFPAKE